MNNLQFLETLKKSFLVYLESGPRSNNKLKVLHGAISADLKNRLNSPDYSVFSLGYNDGRERKINGRYMPKTVDITITEKGKAIAGVAVKYVMSNYSQNSNNYFENMLGETANLRAGNVPYFQIFIIPDRLPYFDKDGTISKWETITPHNLEKYIKLSNDNTDLFFHTPSKTLAFILHFSPCASSQLKNKKDYVNFYTNNPFTITKSDFDFNFGSSIIYNDYDLFMDKIAYTIKGI